MSRLAQLIDKRRAAEAVLYGVHMEIAAALGEKDDELHYQALRNSAIKARESQPEGCYFMEQGIKDRAELAARKVVQE